MNVHVVHLAGPGFRRTRAVVVAAPDADMARVVAETLRPGWRHFACVTGYAIPQTLTEETTPKRRKIR